MGIAVQGYPPWTPVVARVGGQLGGHSCAKVVRLNGMAHWARRPGRLPTSVGTVTVRPPWLLSRKNVKAASWRADDKLSRNGVYAILPNPSDSPLTRDSSICRLRLARWGLPGMASGRPPSGLRKG